MTPAEDKKPWDGYRTIPALPENVEKGIRCGQCGMTFDHGKAYGFVCSNSRCPVFMQVTS